MVLCVCGERIQVPRSALGKTGLCPACGRVISITADAATPVRSQSVVAPMPAQGARPIPEGWGFGAHAAPSPAAEAKRRFAEAVDLYFSRRYAQALSIFQVLAEEYPDNDDIRTGRDMCMTALHSQPQAGLESSTAGVSSSDNGRASGRLRDQLALPAPGEPLSESLVEDTLKRVLFEKMVSGSSDEVQLKAAELAVQVFGFGRNSAAPSSTDGTANREVGSDSEAAPEQPTVSPFAPEAPSDAPL